MRENGFSRPYTPLQVATWITLPVLVIQFLLFLSPLLPLAASIPCTILYLFFASASACYAYMACVIDPIDPLLATGLNQNLDEKHRSCCASWLPLPELPSKDKPRDESVAEEEETKQCWVCEVQVHEHAMHCKYCDKCVAHFDHHCQWLNTCIGQANYPYFFVTLWCLTGMLFTHLAIMIALIVDILTDGETKERANENWIGGSNASTAVAVVLIVFSVLVAVILSLVAQLLWFHLGLVKENLTTYQFIVKDNAKKRQAQKEVATRKQKRIIAISRAKAQGQTCMAWRLACGEHPLCKWCDPLPTPPRREPQQSDTNTIGGPTLSNSNSRDEEVGLRPSPETMATTTSNGTTKSSDEEGVESMRRADEEESKLPES